MPKRPGSKKRSPNGEMPLSGHLREMRNRIGVCLVFLLIAMAAALYFSADVVDLLLEMGRACGYRFVYIAPQELLLQYFSVSLIIALCACLPLILYQVWAFLRPGLSRGENVAVALAMIFGLACFCMGVYFAYRLMLPFMLGFLSGLDTGTGVTASISVGNYLSFLMTIFVIFGAVFELPVVSALLNRLGILKAAWLRKGRRVAIVVIFVVAAVITPPDVVSQVMVALPMMGLYEVSLLLCTAGEKLRLRRGRGAGEE